MLIVNCIICNKEIETYPSWIKSGKSKYCSRECQLPNTNRVLEENGKNTRFVKGQEAWNKKGFTFTQARKGGKPYKLIHMPEHQHASKKGYVREHRLIMERHIGRTLLNNEVVHHRDGDTLNNDINNLQLTNGKEHRRIHLKDSVHKRWYIHPLVSTDS